MKDLYNLTAFKCSQIITQHYSTSFTLGIKTLNKDFHPPIYAIYGFVRYADEIVDTFHEHNKEELLNQFKIDTFTAIENRISLNPVLHAFQLVVNKFGIEHQLINAFLYSMEMDLELKEYNKKLYEEYIYGSAEVVGLMCLRVFCEGNELRYENLKAAARSLGSAFQKINFLRDIKSDFQDRGRIYFPKLDFDQFSEINKRSIEGDIQKDFEHALFGIKRLPKKARLGVYLAYVYYQALFRKIKSLSSSKIITERIRIPNFIKILLLILTFLRYRIGFF